MTCLVAIPACLFVLLACAPLQAPGGGDSDRPAGEPDPEYMFGSLEIGEELPLPDELPELMAACIVDQLSRSTPVQQAPCKVTTPMVAINVLKHIRPNHGFSSWTEAGGYFIFADAQRGSRQPTGTPYCYGVAFKKGDTAVYQWCRWGPEYVSYIRNGATVADNLVCILDLEEWNWRERRGGKPKSLNGGIITEGTSFHIEARIVNLVQNQRNLSGGDWRQCAFVPFLQLYRVESAEPVAHALLPISSKDDTHGWGGGGKTHTTCDVPERAYGDYGSVLASLPPGTYCIIVRIDFDNGTLQSNPQEFTVIAEP